MRRVVPLLGALALVSALSGCSVATQNTATPLPSKLNLAPTTTTPATTIPGDHATHQLQVYFLKDGRLYPVLEYYSTDPLGASLEALGIGPTFDEVNSGITSAFSQHPAQITSAGSKNGVAQISVDSEFTTLPGVSLEEAFAQIVFTVTGLPNEPASVKFFFGQSRMEALIPPGELVNRAVTRTDFCAFAPLSYIPCHKSTGTTGIT